MKCQKYILKETSEMTGGKIERKKEIRKRNK
jgi:hypothetical protein